MKLIICVLFPRELITGRRGRPIVCRGRRLLTADGRVSAWAPICAGGFLAVAGGAYHLAQAQHKKQRAQNAYIVQ